MYIKYLFLEVFIKMANISIMVYFEVFAHIKMPYKVVNKKV